MPDSNTAALDKYERDRDKQDAQEAILDEKRNRLITDWEDNPGWFTDSLTPDEMQDILNDCYVAINDARGYECGEILKDFRRKMADEETKIDE